jgi:GT2 family glycosyltransferase
LNDIARKSEAALTVVIASFNNWHYVRGCLRSLSQGSAGAFEAIVVDNASTDETVDRIREEFPSVVLIVNPTNRGHCHAMNQGIAASRGKFVLVLDGDTVLTPGAADLLVDFLRATPEAAIAAPRMLNDDGTIQETARTFPSVWNGLWGRQSRLTAWFPNHPMARRYLRRDALDATEPFEVDWVSAAAMAFRRDLPEKVGYWDERIRGYWVDADWCKAAHRAGKVFCVPAARVVHFEQNRRNVRKGAARIVLFHQGAYRYYRKHHTRGPWDPRAWMASMALALRAALQLVEDRFLPAASEPKRHPTAKLSSARNAATGKSSLEGVE